MIENLLNSVLGKLADAAFKKFTEIQEVGEKRGKITRELQRLQAFLKDADRKKIKNESQKLWLKEVISVAYDIEDVIDSAPLLEVDTQNTDNDGAITRMFKKARKLPALDKLSNQIDRILARIDEIFDSREKYGINSLGEESVEETMLPLKPLVIPDFDDPNVVGFEPHKENIVKLLLDQNNQSRFVVSIVGTGGLGKTTLARKVYNSSDIKANFQLRVWVAVSEKFELIDIVKKILKQIRPIDPSEQGEETQYFLTQLYTSLREKKYLLVLDDVWTDKLWNHIKEGIINANNGSRVLITSRNEDVANAANPSLDPYKPPLLSEEQSLELLLKKAHYNPDLTNNVYSHVLLDIARKLVEKCRGLPLALVVLGGLLSRNSLEPIVWSNFLQTMSWNIEGRECVDILASSYDDLPLALKFCFMYFAAFPEDYEISVSKLIRMWVAEGFIPQEENRTLEDTAERFLHDLVQRSLVQEFQTLGVFPRRYYQVHDLLRDLAVEKAKEINFLAVCFKKDEERSCREARRVAVHYSDCDELLKYASPSLRTLLCFDSDVPNCSGHKLLRVLTGIQANANHIQGLTQLRYLELRGYMYVKDNNPHFVKAINNMKFLQTLDLRDTNYDNGTSDSIWNIETLRHVNFGSGLVLGFGPPSRSNLRNLQTLTGAKNRESRDTTALPNLPNLRVLQMEITEGFPWEVVAAFLRTLKRLVNLELWWDNIPLNIFDMRGLPFYQKLTSLKLNGKFCHGTGVTIDAAMFPIHLSEVGLYNCKIRQDLMPVLEKLYNLKHLHVAHLTDEHTKTIRCSATGFPRLQILVMESDNLKEWKIEEGAMPKLQHLEIQYSPMLQVPPGLKYLTSLRKLIWGLSKAQSASRKAEEIRNLCRHVPNIYI